MYMANTSKLAWDDNPPATWMEQNNIDICMVILLSRLRILPTKSHNYIEPRALIILKVVTALTAFPENIHVPDTVLSILHVLTHLILTTIP